MIIQDDNEKKKSSRKGKTKSLNQNEGYHHYQLLK